MDSEESGTCCKNADSETTSLFNPHKRPFGHRVIIQLDSKQKKIGELHIPDASQKPSNTGTVVAFGDGLRTRDGDLIPLDLKAGMHIMFDAPQMRDLEDGTHLINFQDIVCELVDH